MNMRTITITGNKPAELNIQGENDPRVAYIKKALTRKILTLLDEGLEWVIVAGQMGVELWTCEVVIELKKSYELKLGVFPPFLEYSSRWPESYQEKFEQISLEADIYKPLYNKKYEGPYQFINKDQWMIHKTDGTVILVDEEYPGSVQYFLERAKKAHMESDYPIIWITPMDLEDIVREEMDHQDFY